MARIEGVDLPRNKRIDIALSYIYGVGRKNAKDILAKAQVEAGIRTQDLSEVEIARIREVIQREYRVEGELRKEIAMNIKRLVDLGTYRGARHKKGLPVRGQRTHTNARTRKGPRRTVAGKKIATK
ncbi:MAG: 30S ribosomal protein S13 [Deltaproteobacteria bacterium]|nr:30S ribosomal protein S13 [Deltaproteobacteria bacterium]